MRKATFIITATAVTAVGASAVPASGAGTIDGVRFTPDIPCHRPATTQLNTETFVDALRTLSFQRVRDVRAAVPRRARGKTAGTLGVGIGVERRRYRLKVPRTGHTSLELLNKGGIRVQLRPGARTFLSVYGLPEGTTSTFITFSGAGRGVIDRPAGDETPTIRLTVYRHAAKPVRLTVSQHCV